VSNYRIEKTRCPITVKTRSGEMLSGHVFLQFYGRYGGPERPIDILNSHEHFFPIADKAGDTLIVSKKSVLFATCAMDADADEERKELSRPVAVEMQLRTGEILNAIARMEVPEDHPRLLDYFNLSKGSFIPLETARGQLIVNKSMIERVKAVE
jgi:hypothetical protein